MALKKKLNDKEKFGLSEEEIRLATRWLRKHKTAGILNESDSAKLFEMFLLGDSIGKLSLQFPQFPLGQIALTAALRGWFYDRERMMHTLQDRVKARVIRSVLDQVDFLTTMLSVSYTEHIDAMLKYIRDPVNNPKPSFKINSIKDYKEVTETLYKLVAGVTNSGHDYRKSPFYEALSAANNPLIKDVSSKNTDTTPNSPSSNDVETSILDVVKLMTDEQQQQ